MNPGEFEVFEKYFHELSSVSPTLRLDRIEGLAVNDAMKKELKELFSIAQKTSILDKSVTAFIDASEGGDQIDLPLGEDVGRFGIIEKIGSGGFGGVYLAKDLDLKRLIALKVAPRTSEEAIHIAQLDHPHIVRVYSSGNLGNNLNFVCMQLVSGCDLSKLMAELQTSQILPKSVSRIIDTQCLVPQEYRRIDVSSASLRSQFEIESYFDFGTRLFAEISSALAHAHEQNIFHLDVKPANILIGTTGRGFLADFNVSTSEEFSQKEFKGGTFQYIAPELLEAESVVSDAITHLCDQYSLGRVASEYFEPVIRTNESSSNVDQQSLNDLKLLISKMEEQKPEDRFENMDECENAFRGLKKLRDIRSSLLPIPFASELVKNHTMKMLVFFALLPQIFASVLNIAFNENFIIRTWTQNALHHFYDLVVTYNIVVYPMAFFIIVNQFRKLWVERNLSQKVLLNRRRYRFATTKTLFAFLSATSVGWLPGAIIFPFFLARYADVSLFTVYFRFMASFLLSWLIALTYTGLVTEYFVARLFLPNAVGVNELGSEQLRRDLVGMKKRVHLWKNLSVLIPLLLAITFLYTGSNELTDTWRHVLVSFIGLGIFGIVFSFRVEKHVHKVFDAFQYD